MTYKFKRFDRVIAQNAVQGQITALTSRDDKPFYYVKIKGGLQYGYFENELEKDETENI